MNKIDIKQKILYPDRSGFSTIFGNVARIIPVLSLLAVFLIAGCNSPEPENEQGQTSAEIVCAPDNGGITLPDGFCETVQKLWR